MNIPISREELVWLSMAVETKIQEDESVLSWYESQGSWDDAETKKADLKRYRDILDKLEVIMSKEEE